MPRDRPPDARLAPEPEPRRSAASGCRSAPETAPDYHPYGNTSRCAVRYQAKLLILNGIIIR